MEGNLKKIGYLYIYFILFAVQEYNIVKQLHSNKDLKDWKGLLHMI